MRVTYWLLFAIYAANYLDRQIFSVMLEAIRQELVLGDMEMGLLSGLAFSLAYGLASIPAAVWASVGNRRNLVACSALIWGLMTMMAGLATGFFQLFVARAAIAAAEAASIPASHSILSDSTHSSGRVKLFGHFTSASAVGGLFAVLIGGVVGHFYGWRMAMICAGLVGILPGLLLFLVPEPKRDYPVRRPRKPHRYMVLGNALRAINANRRARLMFSAETINQIVLSGAIAWYPAFLVRQHDFSQIQAAATASLGGLLAIFGTITTSRIIARLTDRDRDWLSLAPSLLILLGKPFSLVFLLAGNPILALVAFVVPAALSLSTYPPTLTVLHEAVSPAERPVASAMLISVATVLGLGVGPTLVGLLSEAIGGPISLNLALVCLQGFGLVSAYLYWRASRAR
ncbi:MFS transporter [Allorhizobium pseudoryzae]|uniref:MFS transporter n=1 Tax=Allorhizobium pseudoryzae TaxID=379684 RepID=UPI003D008AC2